MPTDIVREDVQRLVQEGAQLVDVRPDAEYQGQRIVGAISLPLKALDTATTDNALDRSRAVVVY
ncbi:MAG: rhodanese-like domain-containing protein [Chloroflexi bacterium]|nr:rhodanese-like domain-containing protein [Chloroflexota bacterium]MCH8064423.1 rhodanese-like domain-containing protein [Chloroflexota bacterium]